MKLELILTRWEDGLFKSRDRIEADDLDSLLDQLNIVVRSIEDKIELEANKRYLTDEDDDIPF